MEMSAGRRNQHASRVRSPSNCELGRIVDIQLGRLEQRLAQRQLMLDGDAAAKKLLASEDYDP